MQILLSHAFRQPSGGKIRTGIRQRHTFSQGELPDGVGVSVSDVHGPVSRRSNIVRHVKVLPEEEAHTRGVSLSLNSSGKGRKTKQSPQQNDKPLNQSN